MFIVQYCRSAIVQFYNSWQIIGERRSIVHVMYMGHWGCMMGVVKKQRANIWEAGCFFRDKLLKLELACQNIFLPSEFLAGNNFGAKIKISSSSDLCSSHDLNCRKCGEVLQGKYSE